MPLDEKLLGRYSDGCYENMRLSEVHTGEHVHQHAVLPVPRIRCPARRCRAATAVSTAAMSARRPIRRWPVAGVTDRATSDEVTVPAGNYLMIGDNRDNSEDGRYWGFVPEANLVGSARRVWFNFDLKRRPWINWSRIGRKID